VNLHPRSLWTVLAQRRTKVGGFLQVKARCACGTVKWLWASNLARCRGCVTCSRGRYVSKFNRLVRDPKLRQRWLQRWHSIVRRCTDPKNHRFKDYGGRGIGVHPRFLDFANFMRYVKRLPGWDVADALKNRRCLDRIKNDRGYEPGNLRMTSYRINSNNRIRRA
jgi:hypothetical protein